MAYHILKDGEVFEVEAKGEVIKFGCCDCALVHRIAFALEKNGKIGVAMSRNQPETLRRRKKLGIIVRKNGKKIRE